MSISPSAFCVEADMQPQSALRESPGSFKSGRGKVLPHLLEKGGSLLKLRVLEAWLGRYPKEQDRYYLGRGFRWGFHIPFQGPRESFITDNLKSVKEWKMWCMQSLGTLLLGFHP